MNKDMINIDDFVRDKLGGHTEKEDSAAWLKMKALLDEEMPERAVPFIFRWKKPMAFLGAALLIGALCVGGYQLNAIREKGLNNTNNAPVTNQNTPDTHNTQAPNHNPATHQENNSQNALASENITTPDGNGTAAEPHANTSVPAAHTNGTNTAPVTRSPRNNNPNQSRTTQPAQHLAAASGSGRSTSASAATIEEKETGTSGSPEKRNAAGARTEPVVKKEKTTAAKASKENRRKNNTWSGSSATAAKKAEKVNDGKTAGTIAKTITPATKETDADKATAAKDAPKDSMKAITVVTKESASKGFPKTVTRSTDTIAETKVALPQQAEVKAAPDATSTTIVSTMQPSKKSIREATAASRKANKRLSKAEAEQQKNTFAAAAPSSANQSKVEKAEAAKKQKSSLSRWLEGMNLPEAVASAKNDARNAQFYPGLSLGGNYSFSSSSNTFQGVQFGPTGELVFNKHWSLFGAIRYFNRGGGTKTVSDNYTTEVSNGTIDSTQGANYFFTVKTDSTSRLFNFSTVHSFEMPLTVRYAFNKFYLMTGINLAFYLPVNVEKVEKNIGIVNSRAVSTNTTKPILAESNGTLNAQDFGSRFGLGYVIGCGYRFSPAWHVDMKLINSFWDNSKGAGAKTLSKDFYRLPSLQLSVGYQFNRGTRKPTYGPTDQH